MKMNDSPHLWLVGLRSVKVVVDRQKVLGGQIVDPLDQDRLAAPCFDGWSRRTAAISPQSRWRQISMQLTLGLPHRDPIVRDLTRRITGIGVLQFALGYGGQRQRIYEFRERIRIQHGRVLRRGGEGNAGLKEEPA